jgi:hypothetical protein
MPLRLTILQLRQIFFTDALTFMIILPKVLAKADQDCPVSA